jgi:hypothetical protein
MPAPGTAGICQDGKNSGPTAPIWGKYVGTALQKTTSNRHLKIHLYLEAD